MPSFGISKSIIWGGVAWGRGSDTTFGHRREGVTPSFTMKPEPRQNSNCRLLHTGLGVTGSNFEMKPERRRMPGFGLHFEVRAGHAELSVQVPPFAPGKKGLESAALDLSIRGVGSAAGSGGDGRCGILIYNNEYQYQ